MKARRIVRVQLMLMGLGAAMLLASSARAQQDMDPTFFDDNPGGAKVERQVTQGPAQRVEPATAVDTEGVIPAALWSRHATQQEVDLARMTLLDTLMVVILMAGTGLIVLYALAATRRERRLQPSVHDAQYLPTSGATTR